MAEAKVGDRISLDAKKVGQPRRGGVVTDVRQGLSGVRLEIKWDDGALSVLAPGAGVLLVEGRAKGNGAKKADKASKASKADKAARAGKPAKAPKGKKAKR
jgi:hypothetical protein